MWKWGNKVVMVRMANNLAESLVPHTGHLCHPVSLGLFIYLFCAVFIVHIIIFTHLYIPISVCST